MYWTNTRSSSRRWTSCSCMDQRNLTYLISYWIKVDLKLKRWLMAFTSSPSCLLERPTLRHICMWRSHWIAWPVQWGMVQVTPWRSWYVYHIELIRDIQFAPQTKSHLPTPLPSQVDVEPLCTLESIQLFCWWQRSHHILWRRWSTSVHDLWNVSSVHHLQADAKDNQLYYLARSQ